MRELRTGDRARRPEILPPICLAIAGLLMPAPGGCSASAEVAGVTALRVMTFNILHSSIRNPVGAWKDRRAPVVRTLRAAHADIVCLQEVSAAQIGDLASDLPEYLVLPGAPSGRSAYAFWALMFSAGLTALWLALVLRARRVRARGRLPAFVRSSLLTNAMLTVASVGLSRFILGDFLERGEHCPILLLRERVTATERGSYWLSPHPDRAGSTLPGSPTPHVVTWARIEDRHGGPPCVVYNTHLGLLPWTAGRTARELLAQLDHDWDGATQILAGDFNATPRSALLRALLASRAGPAPAFRDAWTEARHHCGTASTFRLGSGAAGPRIDYILVRPSPGVASATTTTSRDVHPSASDHRSLLAELLLAGPGVAGPRVAR